MQVGLTNYAACYATGLLLARRVLTNLGLADLYQGNPEAAAPSEDGGLYHVEEEGDKRPFRAFLDVGLVRTTTGSKVFAVMKVCGGRGALDVLHGA
jgi:large subunit ribosomal protein L5e